MDINKVTTAMIDYYQGQPENPAFLESTRVCKADRRTGRIR